MFQPTPELNRLKRFPSADNLNRLRDRTERVEARRPQNATQARLRAGEIRAFRIKNFTTHADVIIARAYDGAVEDANDIAIARNYLCRRTPFDGVAVNGITATYSNQNTRSATDGTDTETQVIIPEYYVDAVIYAAYVPEGGTQVADPLVVGRDCLWLDLNGDGRAWAANAS